jgi:hypothetical protein
VDSPQSGEVEADLFLKKSRLQSNGGKNDAKAKRKKPRESNAYSKTGCVQREKYPHNSKTGLEKDKSKTVAGWKSLVVFRRQAGTRSIGESSTQVEAWGARLRLGWMRRKSDVD